MNKMLTNNAPPTLELVKPFPKHRKNGILQAI